MSMHKLFESLEARKHLSATLDPVTHVLSVTGGPAATNDKIEIFITPPPASGAPPAAPKLVVKDLVANTTKEFNPLSVQRINIVTGDGADVVNVSPRVLQPTRIDLGAGDDKSQGGSGPTEILGGPGNDTLNGGRGPDLLSGGDGKDVLNGGDGPDKLRGGRDADIFNGGAGIDLVDYGNATVALVVSLDNVANDGATGEGDNVLASVENILGGSAGDSLSGSAGNNRLDGGAGNDTLRGFGSHDELNGGAGNDKLDGGSGPDALFGGDGNDTLIGGHGRDRLSGGAGNDYFIANDGEIDTLLGGAGADTKLADATDILNDIP